MTELACGLKRLGHTVEFFVYFPEYDFFTDRVEAAGIPVHRHRKGRGFSFAVIRKLIALMRNRDFDLVLAFLNSPIIYAELARLVARKPILVVSERCSHHDDRSARLLLTGGAHCIRRRMVVSTSETHAAWLRNRWYYPGKSPRSTTVSMSARSVRQRPGPRARRMSGCWRSGGFAPKKT